MGKPQCVFFGVFNMAKLGQDPKIFVTGNEAIDTDGQIEGNK